MLDRLYLLKLIGEVISIKYEQASYYLSKNGYVRDKGYKEILDKIREFIIIEDKIISAMTLEQLEDLRNIIRKELKASKFTDEIIARTGNRVFHQIDCLNGIYVKVEDIGLDNIFPEGTVFSLEDIIHSKFNIDMLKSLNWIINALKPSNSKDLKFIEGLKLKLEISKKDLYAELVSLEAIGMFCDNDIDRLPDIDLDTIKEVEYLSVNTKVAINNYVSNTLDRLKHFLDRNNQMYIENDPDDVYAFLMVIARIEVIIPYLSKKELNKYKNIFRKDCIFIGEHTINVVHVKNMIRKRLKEI